VKLKQNGSTAIDEMERVKLQVARLTLPTAAPGVSSHCDDHKTDLRYGVCHDPGDLNG
jgi:hypothetical protein